MQTGDRMLPAQNTSAVTMLARIEAICGPLPADMLAVGHHSHLYYTRSRQLYERDAQSGAVCLLEPHPLPLAQVLAHRSCHLLRWPCMPAAGALSLCELALHAQVGGARAADFLWSQSGSGSTAAWYRPAPHACHDSTVPAVGSKDGRASRMRAGAGAHCKPRMRKLPVILTAA